MTRKQLEKELQKTAKHWIGDIICSQWMDELFVLIDKYVDQEVKRAIKSIKK